MRDLFRDWIELDVLEVQHPLILVGKMLLYYYCNPDVLGCLFEEAVDSCGLLRVLYLGCLPLVCGGYLECSVRGVADVIDQFGFVGDDDPILHHVFERDCKMLRDGDLPVLDIYTPICAVGLVDVHQRLTLQHMLGLDSLVVVDANAEVVSVFILLRAFLLVVVPIR